MIREEAIELLEDIIGFVEDNHGRDYDEAFRMAIESLQKDIERHEMVIRASERHLGLVRCKDCKHRDTDECLMYYEEWYEIDEGGGYADTDFIIHDYTRDDGFCHHGERREP